MTSESNKQKIAKIHETFPTATKDNIAIILQYYEDDENEALDALTRDGGSEALSNWADFGSLKSKNNKKKRKGQRELDLAGSATASFDVDDSSNLHSSVNVEVEKECSVLESRNGFEKCKKDLNRQAISFKRIYSQVQKGLDEPSKKLKTAFNEVNKLLDKTREQVEHLLEIEDIISSSNDKKIDYNKNNIEKILYRSTKTNIEVFLGYSNEPKQETLHYFTIHELIEQAKLYISKGSYDAHYYLVVNLNKEGLVDIAYLAYLHNNKKRECWKCSIIPLIDYWTIQKKLAEFLCVSSDYILVHIYHVPNHYDKSITSGSIEQVIEYAKLRMKYPIPERADKKQYESEFNNVKLAEYGTYTGVHQDILKQFTSNIETTMKEQNLKTYAENTMQCQLNSTNVDTKDYNDQDITSLTGEYNES